MHYITSHWSFDPFLMIAAILAGWHETGLRRLARRSRAGRTRQRRLRSVWFYAGLAVLLIAVESPVDYWSDDYFFVHMFQHLLLMFAAPTLIVAAAPWQPLLDALPASFRRDATRSVFTGGWSRPLRAAGGALLRPWTAVVAFNAVMVAWHIPALFNLSLKNEFVHIWLLHGSFFAAGVLFWLQFIPSPPIRPRMPHMSQAAALIVTNVVMWLMAMSLSIFSHNSWYAAYANRPGVTLPAFADQQIGAAILWVCGDFWAVPMLIVVVRRLIAADGGLGMAIDRILGKGSARGRWTSTARPAGGVRLPRQRPAAGGVADPPAGN